MFAHHTQIQHIHAILFYGTIPYYLLLPFDTKKPVDTAARSCHWCSTSPALVVCLMDLNLLSALPQLAAAAPSSRARSPYDAPIDSPSLESLLLVHFASTSSYSQVLGVTDQRQSCHIIPLQPAGLPGANFSSTGMFPIGSPRFTYRP